MKAGLSYSDFITTVSKKYSEEIRTPRYGENLDGLLRSRSDVLYGITNGIDYQVWDPATDQSIARNYDLSSIEGKMENKLALQRENNMPEDPKIPLFGIVSRLSVQKGLDIVADAIHHLLSADVQFVLLGTGDERYQRIFRQIADEFPEKTGIHIVFDEDMARRIYAGSDMFLMPSRYEPCGLGQLISMRYGTIPIVRNTGGLADTVQHYDPDSGTGTGFRFEHETPDGLMWGVERALDVYYDEDRWKQLIINAMDVDFSWNRSAREYADLYEKAIQGDRGNA